MKKSALVILAVAALAAGGCSKKEEAPKAPAQQATAPGMPAPAPGGGDPHAGLKPQEVPAGVGHKGKVLETMNAAGYTYAQVEENGQKLWVAVLETKIKQGDVVEFPDSPPMMNFHSKSLNRTFDKIIFAPGMRVAGK